MAKITFDNPYDAGYDAGLNGSTTTNCHFSYFGTKEKMELWQKGNDAGRNKKKEIDYSKKLKQ